MTPTSPLPQNKRNQMYEMPRTSSASLVAQPDCIRCRSNSRVQAFSYCKECLKLMSAYQLALKSLRRSGYLFDEGKHAHVIEDGAKDIADMLWKESISAFDDPLVAQPVGGRSNDSERIAIKAAKAAIRNQPTATPTAG